MANPIYERLNGVRAELDSKRVTASGRANERSKEQPQPPVAGAGLNRTDFGVLKSRIQRRIIAELAPEADLGGVPGRRAIEDLFNDTLAEEGVPLPRLERTRLLEAIMAELLSFGPIEPLLRDESISEIMVNGPDQIWIERAGPARRDGRQVRERRPRPANHRPDRGPTRPPLRRIVADGRCPSARWLARERDHPTALTDRAGRHHPKVLPRSPHDAAPGPVRLGHAEIADFLGLCVQGALNVIVSGGTGSGKTTLLNVLSSFIPGNERIITIEDAAELRLRQRHVISLEKRPANIEGTGEVAIRQLMVNSLRMRPDRIVVGEVRGPEALDMLQAMNTGHDGSMTTLHSNGPRDTLARLETMVMMAGVELPHRAIREQIASAVDLIVHQERLFDGSRKVTHVSEVQGMEGDVIILQDIFRFEQTGLLRGKVQGNLRSSGIRPKFELKLARNGVKLNDAMFSSSAAMRFSSDARPPQTVRGGH